MREIDRQRREWERERERSTDRQRRETERERREIDRQRRETEKEREEREIAKLSETSHRLLPYIYLNNKCQIVPIVCVRRERRRLTWLYYQKNNFIFPCWSILTIQIVLFLHCLLLPSKVFTLPKKLLRFLITTVFFTPAYFEMTLKVFTHRPLPQIRCDKISTFTVQPVWIQSFSSHKLLAKARKKQPSRS